MSPPEEMNRVLLAAGTPFVDAAGTVAAYGLGKRALTNARFH